MKLNREKIAALLALVLVVLGLKGVVEGFIAPTRSVRVPDVTLTRRSREVLPRSYRTFTADAESGRNPFSFSEGWRRTDAEPLAPPPLPGVPRILPSLAAGAGPGEAGFIYADRSAALAGLAAAPANAGVKEPDSKEGAR
jgi:hypothetical protein